MKKNPKYAKRRATRKLIKQTKAAGEHAAKWIMSNKNIMEIIGDNHGNQN